MKKDHQTQRRTANFLAQASLALSLAIAVAGWSPAYAQDSVPIQFAAGATSTTINGAVRGDEYIDYVVNARGGQTMVVSLAVTGSNGNGSAFFNILPAGQDFGGPYVGSTDDDRRAEIEVPYDGDWAIRVYLMGNDRDTDKTVGYSIDVYIAPGAGGGSSQAGILPEEDFFVVNLSGAGVLNVRDAPRPSGQKIGEFRNGTVVRNMGGCTVSDGQQWCNVQASSGGVVGWVAARFLSLPGPGGGDGANADDGGGAMDGAPPNASGDVAEVAGVASNDILNVRSGPGTGNRIVGALANGDRVINLGCQSVGNSRWCEIEMMTDMRERGWVNARFLTGQSGQATQLPSASRMERVRFDAGMSGTEFFDQLGPGTSVTYILGAQAEQFLYFRLAANGSDLSYKIFNPDGSVLLDEMDPSQEYRGQLWQSGDHKIEVFNRASGARSYNVIFGIE